MTFGSPGALALLVLLRDAARGTKRDGLFAIWLTLRVIEDLNLDPPYADRLNRQRVVSLEHRLSSLTVPAPLRRALAGALGLMADGTPKGGHLALMNLVAPVRESLGPEVAEVLTKVIRALKDAAKTP